MQTIGKLVSSMSNALEFNQATLSGCVDIIVVRQPDGSLKSTPFHIRFGKLKLLKSRNTSVMISINSEQTALNMKLGDAGEGFFEEEESSPLVKNESYKIVQKSQSEKENQATTIEESADIKGVSNNKSLLKMLRLKSSPPTTTANTKAETGALEDVEDYFEDEGAQKANEFIFLDEIKGKSVSEPLKLSTKTPQLHFHRAHSQGYVEPPKTHKKTTKTLRPSSAQLLSLNLRPGVNTITYTVKSSLQGAQHVNGNIFLWSHDDNIIISDIDGTITKSDVMGHLMSMVGKDWSQPGIAPLYTNIRRNGYHIIYLTSRAIGQAKQTRDFVNSVHQDGKMLPSGPLITSPDGMLSSVKREMIYKRPDIFKCAALKDIRNIFPEDYNPFHAGFGNRETDAIAYKSVGIPLERVFIVNPKGDLHHHGHNHRVAKSYAVLNSMIKEVFPGIIKSSKALLAERLNSENLLDLKDERLMQANLIKVVS